MRAGDLNERVTFQKKTTEKSDFGGYSVTWVDDFSTNATVTFRNGQRLLDSKEIFNQYIFAFYIRIFHKVDESMRIIYDGKKYKILSIYKNKAIQAIEIIGELINE